jgi:hypothetical protein
VQPFASRRRWAEAPFACTVCSSARRLQEPQLLGFHVTAALPAARSSPLRFFTVICSRHIKSVLVFGGHAELRSPRAGGRQASATKVCERERIVSYPIVRHQAKSFSGSNRVLAG